MTRLLSVTAVQLLDKPRNKEEIIYLLIAFPHRSWAPMACLRVMIWWACMPQNPRACRETLQGTKWRCVCAAFFFLLYKFTQKADRELIQRVTNVRCIMCGWFIGMRSLVVHAILIHTHRSKSGWWTSVQCTHPTARGWASRAVPTI